jgi:hypothetical protein
MSSPMKRKPSKNQHHERWFAASPILDPDDGGNMYLENMRLSPNYKVLQLIS